MVEATTSNTRRRASLVGTLSSAGESLNGWVFQNQHASIQQLVATSPIAYHSEVSSDELDAFARSFVTIKFKESQKLPKSAFMFVVDGTVNITIHDEFGQPQKIKKQAGEWFINPAAVSETDLDAHNYAWFYAKQLQAMLEPDEDLPEMSELNLRNSVGPPPKRTVWELLTCKPKPNLNDRRSTAVNERHSAAGLKRKANAHRKTSQYHHKQEQRVFIKAQTEGTVHTMPMRTLLKFMGASRQGYETIKQTLQVHGKAGLILPDFMTNIPELTQETLSHQCVYTSYESGSIVFTPDTPTMGLYLVLHGTVFNTNITRSSYDPTLEETLQREGASSDNLMRRSMTRSSRTSRERTTRSSTVRPSGAKPGLPAGGSSSSTLRWGETSLRLDNTQQDSATTAALEGDTTLGSELREGSYLGETAFVLRWKHQGTAAVTKSKCLICFIPMRVVALMGSYLPDLSMEIEDLTKRKMLETFRNDGLPFFADLNDDGVYQVAKRATLDVGMRPHALICEPSDAKSPRTRQLYIVLGGKVHAQRRQNEQASGSAADATGGMLTRSSSTKLEWVLPPGQYFGEVPLIVADGKPAAAYESGKSGCSLLLLPRQDWLQLFASDRSLLTEMKIKLLRKKCSLPHVLQHTRTRGLFSNFVDARRMGMSHCLEFNNAVERYVKVEALNLPAALAAISQSIVGEFVMRRSPHVVPMNDESRQTILAHHKKGAVPSRLFLEEKQRIFDELEGVDLPAFLTSRNFQELLTALGANTLELIDYCDALEGAKLTQMVLEFEGVVGQAAAEEAANSGPAWMLAIAGKTAELSVSKDAKPLLGPAIPLPSLTSKLKVEDPSPLSV